VRTLKKYVYYAGVGLIIIVLIVALGFLGISRFFSIFDDVQEQHNFHHINGDYIRDNPPYTDPSSYFSGDDSIASRQATSPVAVLGDYRIITEKRDDFTINTPYCLNEPDKDNVNPTYIDSDSCQHWSYTERIITSGVCSYRNDCNGACSNIGLSYTGNNYGKPGQCNYDACDCYRTQAISDFGGISYTSETTYGCFGKYSIYKNGNLLKAYDWTDEQIFYEHDGFHASFNQNSKYWKGNGYSNGWWKCLRLTSNYQYVIPENKLNIQMFRTDDVYFVGDEFKLNVMITNDWMSIKGNLSLLFEIPTLLGNKETIKSQIIIIPLGESIHTFSFEVESAEEVVYVTPELLLFDDTYNFAGVNTNCKGALRNVESCDQINLDVYEGEKQSFSVDVVPVETTTTTTIPIYEPEPCGFWCTFWRWIKSLFGK